jgi:DNA-binding transcriptional LysR family regulator
MREADVAIRLRQPTQPDLIQHKLFPVHFHVYASPEYLKRFGTPHARRLLRLSGRAQDRGARAGVPRFSRRQRAALEFSSLCILRERRAVTAS